MTQSTTHTRRHFLALGFGLTACRLFADDIKLFITSANLGGTNVARVTVIYPPGMFYALEKSTAGGEWSPVMPSDFIARRRLNGSTDQFDFLTKTNKLVLVQGSDRLNLNLPVGMSIYDGMKGLSTQSNFVFETTPFSDLGMFVKSFGGIVDQNGYHWTLYINNQEAEMGASAHIIKTGDQIAWKYEKRS